jgi:2,4-dienoyl-CoA reductase-like NADH-dependent reductase (Old Yellow Enzyme family)
MTDTDILFQPFELGTLKLANRIVMAPMTRNKSAGNIPGPAVVEYYRRRARRGGAGLSRQRPQPGWLDPQDHRQAGDHCAR